MKRILTMILLLGLVVPAFAADTGEKAATNGTDCASDVRPVVKTVFEAGEKAGKPLETMVAEAIKIGPNLCGVLVVARELGYAEEAVLAALQKARVDNNVIARVAMDAGCDPQVVARVVGQEELAGLGYTSGPAGTVGTGGTGGAPVATPATIGGGGRGVSTVSPSAVQ
ncbi:hypothetical protein EDC39_107140 [Geothermobacter ehrlichii]|uniref:Uncharacterized protein n=1 Tax=Geothermobacter ehrlichii TaxID=213224 RepID=A0A5D3WHL4_9BACT|nr:hypothetical protein [Geothermobacter ehrlichii]TYO98339.1 hypothetical protein EDC39_107140 [Geothermobacter ehrlichii]